MAALANRMAHELRVLAREPPEGVAAAPVGDSITRLAATVQGPPGTVYEGGWFRLSVVVPERYPFEPPKVSFDTPVYHPNIDARGRVCLDLLGMPPKGSWRPSLTLATVLAGCRQLLADPNPRDPLEPGVTEEYLNNRSLFELKARDMVARHATAAAAGANVGPGAGAGAGGSGGERAGAAAAAAGPGNEGAGEGAAAAAAAAAPAAAAAVTAEAPAATEQAAPAAAAAAAADAAAAVAGRGPAASPTPGVVPRPTAAVSDAVPSPGKSGARDAVGSLQQAAASPAAKRARLEANERRD